MKKINIAELLKDCPRGMELDCLMFDNVVFEGVDQDECYPIKVKIKEHPITLSLTKYGGWNLYNSAKCVIFPKGKTTWEGFVPPCEFKDGDVVVSRFGGIHLLRTGDSSYCAYRMYWTGATKFDNTITTSVEVARLATEEEKQKLFDAIKDNGYKWNEETKTLEKLVEPKFKVGDKIQSVISSSYYTVVDIKNDQYFIKSDTEKYPYQVPFSNEINYKLVPNKFDITTLKPFDEVLVRSHNSDVWECDFFSLYNPECSNRFHCIGAWYNICIPYIGNEHLRGTTNDCDEYFKNW